MKNKLSHKRIIAILFALALTLQMAAPGFVWDKSFAEDGSGQQTLLGVEPKEDASGEQKASDAKTSDSKATDSSVKDPEEQPNIPAWIDVVVIDGITIKASAEKGALPKTAKLKVTGTADNDAANIMKILEGMRGEERAQVATHIYQVSITDSDSKELKPADNMKVKIAFESNEFSAEGVDMRMYIASGSDIKEVDSGEVDIERETTIVIDVTKAAETSKAEEKEKTETGDGESTEEKGKEEEEQKDIEQEDTAPDDEVEKASKKKSATGLRATPDTGLFVGTNMAMVLIIAVAVIAGGLIAVLSFRRREL